MHQPTKNLNSKINPTYHRFFKIAIFMKGLDGVLEVLGSLILLFLGSEAIPSITSFLIRKELTEDPQDFIANYLLDFSKDFLPSTHFFIIIYLLLHGLVKIALVLGLNSQKNRMQKTAEAVLIFLIFYQLYRFSHTHSWVLLGFLSIDIAIVILLNLEHRKFNQNKSSNI